MGLIDGQPSSWNESHFEYAHRDHLGSIEVVTDDSVAELHRLAFEPFGSRKQKDWSGNITASELNSLLARGQGHAPRVRGFTGHEHLDRTGFIHMNGRIYDPVLGRFLSPDPFVQFPTFSQNWNRYSYIDNKPTSFTDLSGFFQNTTGGEDLEALPSINVQSPVIYCDTAQYGEGCHLAGVRIPCLTKAFLGRP